MARRAIFFISLLLIAGIWIACGGGSSTSRTTAQQGTVNVSVSDPTTCSVAAGGNYASIYVAITGVKIHTSSTASDNDPNWIDLTPSLTTAKGTANGLVQVDLLGLADNSCFLKMLGSNTAIQAGTYQQIRITLADNTKANADLLGAANKCGANAVNCVITKNSSTPQTLLLSGETKTGIKIPSGQIAGGQFKIGAGETKDLNIDIDSCASIVVDQGNGQFRLKPVLHAGEVSTTSASINGKLIDKATGQPINGGKAIVALEQKDADGIDRVIMQTTPDATGAFNFCPVPAGTYDVVAVAMDGSNNIYAATIVSGVAPGNAVGNIAMNAVMPATTGGSTLAATMHGTVTTAGASGGVGDDVSISALQQVTSGGPTLTFTIPVGAQSATLSVTTTKPASCTGSTCPAYSAEYMLSVPPVNPTMGTFASSGITYTAGASGNASYLVEALAFKPQSGAEADCNPAKITSAAVSVSAGMTSEVPPIAFVGCTATTP